MQAVAEKVWCNADNRDFYDCVDLGRYARIRGLGQGVDVGLAQRFIPSQDSAVLEVGAGDGRVLDILLNNGFTNITALERSEQFHHVSQKFSHHLTGRLKLWQGDLTEFRTAKRFDVILMMFGLLTEFSAQEQAFILRRLGRNLSKNGKLIVDLPLGDCPNLSVARESYVDYKKIRCRNHIPAMKDLVQYGKSAGMRLSEGLPYVTENGLTRTLLIYTRT